MMLGCNLIQNKINLKENSFHIIVDDKVEKEIYESRGRKIDLGNSAKLYFGDTLYELDDITTRGQTALNYVRKNFLVKVKGKFQHLDKFTHDTLKFEKFVLSSMSMDHSYFENKIAHILLSEVNLWHLHTFYTELYINNSHQGLYLFIENLKEHASKELEAKCLLRRGYNHYITEIKSKNDENLGDVLKRGYNHYIASKLRIKKLETASDPYKQKFDHIYNILTVYSGKELYDSIKAVLNLDNYMKKIAMDEILENGDYTDEIYFYSKSTGKEKIYFDIIPWDYDDIFSNMPHEIGRTDSLCGRKFGIRVYPNYEDYKKETKGRLIFSIEDDLDYAIMTDDYLYSKYLEILGEIVDKFDNDLISGYFQNIEKELDPFYQIQEVISQSKLDENETTLAILKNNIQEKQKRLLDRMTRLRIEVALQTK